MRRCRWIVFISLAIFLLQLVPTSFAWGSVQPETKAPSAVLMEASTGKIIYQKNPHQRIAPASVTKVVTLLVAMDALKDGKVKWNDRVVTSEAAWEMGGSEIWLEPGEEMSFKEMMIAIAVGSANDACVAVAEHIAGSEKAFVGLMNQKVKELGLKNTHFVNCHGLPAKGHYTSAYDMAMICREAAQYPEYLELTSIKHYYKLRGGKTKLDNTNKLLWYYEGTDGFKTGWTAEANYCLASTVKRGDLRLICCVFGIPEIDGHFKESIKLYNWGFANYTFKQLVKAGEVVGEVRVGKGTVDRVGVVAPQGAGILLQKGEDKKAKTEIKLLPYLNAPVSQGDTVGELKIIVDGKTYEKVPLVAQRDVPRGSFWHQLKKSLWSVAG
ncbi:MAG: D-alanyl-D-alanine carboxypeptidase family protein [Syntrophaceticus sp.]